VKTLFNLLFELSNEDRFNILHRLQDNPQRISEIARRLNLTRQETSRNLARLCNSQLVQRNVNGLFNLTSYGEYVIKLLPGYTFLTKNADYFTTHTLSFLPHEFFYRIGDLANCPHLDDALLTFDDCERLINTAEQYLWFITHQYSVSMLPHLQHALERHVQIRIITFTDLPPPPGYFEHEFVQAFQDAYKPAVQSGQYEERHLPTLTICLGVADPQQGHIVFPTMNGGFDYKGFTVIDNQSHCYSKDLFVFYWNQAQLRYP
jgi:predicted transcriptional regulator